MLRIIIVTLVLICIVGPLAGCSLHQNNPPAEGFNTETSDVKAIRLANATMRAMGGREAWDNTRYITWDFFGRRTHIWDRYARRNRIEYRDDDGSEYVLVINLVRKRGVAWVDGDRVTDHAELDELMDRAWKMWVNDSYWLVMPYKLKDSGVTLTYVGEGETRDGVSSDIVQLTFDGVGVTPNNKYHVWIAKNGKLVRQFAYYENESDPEPTIVAPWRDWKQYGNIMLSGDRGERQITDIAVLEHVPAHVWTSSQIIDVPER